MEVGPLHGPALMCLRSMFMFFCDWEIRVDAMKMGSGMQTFGRCPPPFYLLLRIEAMRMCSCSEEQSCLPRPEGFKFRPPTLRPLTEQI
eukprot:76989-Pelagomonas_calceolata.AAC.2